MKCLAKYKTDALEIVSNDLESAVEWGQSSELIRRRLCGVNSLCISERRSEYIPDLHIVNTHRTVHSIGMEDA